MPGRKSRRHRNPSLKPNIAVQNNAQNNAQNNDSSAIDRLVDEAVKINKDYKERSATPQFAALSVQQKYEFYQRNHPSFAKMFSIPLRYMVEIGMFSKKAFRKQVENMHNNPYTNKTEYCERQADYVLYLYRSQGKSLKDATQRRQDVLDALLKEINAFDIAEKKIKERNDHDEKEHAAERRAELIAMLMNLQNPNPHQ